MNKQEKREALKYINTQKRKFFDKYFKYKNIDTITKNIVKNLSLKFSATTTLFYFALYGYTRLINTTNFTLDSKQGAKLDSYHKSFVKINMHADMINKEFENIIDRCKNV